MKTPTLYILLTILIITLTSPLLLASEKNESIPHLMRFQGTLGTEKGVPLDGIFTLTFRIYDSENGGTTLWEEAQNQVSIKEGLIDAELGSATPLDLPFDKQYWLSIEVESDGEMAPRFKLTSVPYSITSEK